MIGIVAKHPQAIQFGLPVFKAEVSANSIEGIVDGGEIGKHGPTNIHGITANVVESAHS